MRGSPCIGYWLIAFMAGGCDEQPSRSPGDEVIHLAGQVSPGREQVLAFAAPTARGGIFRVTLAASAGADELGVSVSSRASGHQSRSHVPFDEGQQRVGVVSEGGVYEARVSASRARAAPGQAFTLDVEQLPRPLNDCCSPGSGPGCRDAETLMCVCERDNDCCSNRYDDFCVAEAIGQCELRCTSPASPSDCRDPSAASGCLVPEVAACVCGIDPYCCAGSFDQNCVNLATNRCAALAAPVGSEQE